MRQTLILLQLSLWVTSIYAFYPFVPDYLLQEGRDGARRRTGSKDVASNSKTSRSVGSIAFPLSRRTPTDVGPPYPLPLLLRVTLTAAIPFRRARAS